MYMYMYMYIYIAQWCLRVTPLIHWRGPRARFHISYTLHVHIHIYMYMYMYM